VHHRKPAGRHVGRHRAPADVRSRYAVVVTTAVVGAGVVAFGASSALPAVNPVDTTALAAGGAGTAGQGAALAQSTEKLTQARTATTQRASRSQTRVAAPKPAPDWTRPASGPMSSTFGPRWGTFHYGIDIAAGYGNAVRATHAGTVVTAGWYGGYGYAVIIDHGNGLTTRYGHNSKVLVSVGERVKAGDQIANVGNTGDSTGPHVHFEVRMDGVAVNPVPFLMFRGVDLRSTINSAL
jgi:murein DD-endopeptidase MepM/ murein hydrolase activator NlpD